jgi:hypothetical protein
MILDIRSVRANMEAFARYRIRPRILVNVDKVDMSVDFCGYKVRPLSSFVRSYTPLARAHPRSMTSFSVLTPARVLAYRVSKNGTSRRRSGNVSSGGDGWHTHDPVDVFNDVDRGCR